MLYTVVDVETTGLSPRQNRIIEIGAVKVLDGKVQNEYFHTIVNPGEEVSLFILSLTEIPREEIMSAPSIEHVMPDFLEFLGKDSVFVGHNARFDYSFINEELRRYFWKPIKNEVVDTIRLAKRRLPGLQSYRLEALINYFGFNHKKNHRALDDAKITAEILLKLLDDKH
ncbi:3'-5' exonuclease [Candidatus Dojkabacteria bacterium]|nr:3'-5' exonuclease [Candidatus Dojkabacteria bacterium]